MSCSTSASSSCYQKARLRFAKSPFEHSNNYYFNTTYYIILKLFIVELPSLLCSKHPMNNPWIAYQFHFGYFSHSSLKIPASALHCFTPNQYFQISLSSIFNPQQCSFLFYVGRESLNPLPFIHFSLSLFASPSFLASIFFGC